jgi:cytochrome c peroxidase
VPSSRVLILRGLALNRGPQMTRLAWILALAALVACERDSETAPPDEATAPAPGGAERHPRRRRSRPDRAALSARAKAVFGTLPCEAANAANPSTDAKIDARRGCSTTTRASRRARRSRCNSCHKLGRHSASTASRVLARSQGPARRAQFAHRLNAALQFVQFWDGRAADVEAQAKGPVLNPVEMACRPRPTCCRCSIRSRAMLAALSPPRSPRT